MAFLPAAEAGLPSFYWMSEGSDPTRRTPSERSFGAVSMAFEWSSRIMAVSAEMVLPGLAGWWLDGKTGWNVFAVTGFAVGLVVGVVHLIAMTRPLASQGQHAKPQRRSPKAVADEVSKAMSDQASNSTAKRDS